MCIKNLNTVCLHFNVSWGIDKRLWLQKTDPYQPHEGSLAISKAF